MHLFVNTKSRKNMTTKMKIINEKKYQGPMSACHPYPPKGPKQFPGTTRERLLQEPWTVPHCRVSRPGGSPSPQPGEHWAWSADGVKDQGCPTSASWQWWDLGEPFLSLSYSFFPWKIKRLYSLCQDSNSSDSSLSWNVLRGKLLFQKNNLSQFIKEGKEI